MAPVQIFVSYARADDLSPPDIHEAKGFVTFLHEQLRYEFQQLGHPVPQIWRDERVDPGDQFEPLIEQAIRDSSIFLVVLSRNWLSRPWCLRELNYFSQQWGIGDDRIRRRRIIVVAKHHLNRDELPHLLQGQTGYAFFEFDAERGIEREFFSRGKIVDGRYSVEMKALSNYLWRRAKSLSQDDVQAPGTRFELDVISQLGIPYSYLNSGDLPESEDLANFHRRVREFLAGDQIEQSGGWPRSWFELFHYNTGMYPTDDDRREGGLISTYAALRGLAATDAGLSTLTGTGAAAYRYLRDRQEEPPDGGLGRFVRSRTGSELKPTFRHTALGFLALALIRAPVERIIRALNYIAKLTPQSVAADSARSIAVAATLAALEVAAHSDWAEANLNAGVRDRMLRLLVRNQEKLVQILESECKDPETGYAPLWVPYGTWKPMTFMTALTTIDLLTLFHRPPWPIIREALRFIATKRTGDALPYDTNQTSADIGISSFFAVICYRPNVREHLVFAQEKKILEMGQSCLQFCLENADRQQAWEHVYADTISSALLLRKSNDHATDL